MRRLIGRLEESNDDEDPLYVVFANLDGEWHSVGPNRDADGFSGAFFSFSKARSMAYELSNINGDQKPTERQRRNGEMPGYHTEIYKIEADDGQLWDAAREKYLGRDGDRWDYDTVKDEGKLMLSEAPPDPEDDDYDKGAGGLDDRQMRER
jgi:hypothetical protein